LLMSMKGIGAPSARDGSISGNAGQAPGIEASPVLA
jgi:hypothetical protein